MTLTGADTLELLAKAPTPAVAARLTLAQISAALKRARRRDIPGKAAAIREALRTEHLGQAEIVASAYAASVRATVAVLQTLNTEITTLEEQVGAHFGQHPDAEVYLSQPGIGVILGARVLAEFGDAPGRYADAKSRKNYAGTAPITRQSGKSKTVHARFIHNDRLVDALHMQAGAAILHDPGARAHYDELRARDTGHNAALRQLGNRLVGILHGCLKPTPPTTPQPPGHTATNTSPLDNKAPGVSDRSATLRFRSHRPRHPPHPHPRRDRTPHRSLDHPDGQEPGHGPAGRPRHREVPDPRP